MGSFNVTCFASNQIIVTSQKVRVFGIHLSSSFNPVKLSKGDVAAERFGCARVSHGPNSIWQPLGSGLRGSYNDYGKFEFDLTGESRASAINLILEVLIYSFIAEEGENSSHELAFNLKAFIEHNTPELFKVISSLKQFDTYNSVYISATDDDISACLDYIQEAVQEDRVFLSEYNGAIVPFKFAVVSEIAYQEFIKYQESKFNFRGLPLDRKSYLTRVVQDCHAKVIRMREIRKAATPPRESTAFDDSSSFFTALCDNVIRDSENACVSSTEYLDLFMEFADNMYVQKNITDEDLISNLIPICADYYFFKGLDSVNVSITPVLYSNQGYSNSEGTAYAEIVANISKAVTRDLNYLQHGSPIEYELHVLDDERYKFSKLIDSIKDSDGYIETISDWILGAHSSSFRMIKVAVPFQDEDMLEICSNVLDNFDLQRITKK